MSSYLRYTERESSYYSQAGFRTFISNILDDDGRPKVADSAEKKKYDKAAGDLHKFGIEKTFVAPLYDQADGEKNEVRVVKLLKKIAISMKSKLTIPVHDCGVDPGCVEVSSSPMTSMAQAEIFFKETSKLALGAGLVHAHPAILGTGGHIHVEALPDNPLRQWLYVFGAMNPWLNLFCHPLDDQNANSVGHIFTKKLIQELNRGARVKSGLQLDVWPCYYSEIYKTDNVFDAAKSINVLAGLLHNQDGIDTDPNYDTMDIIKYLFEEHDVLGKLVIKPRFETMEFRCFDTTTSWNEQKLHIEFVQAVVKYAKENGKHYTPNFLDALTLVQSAYLKPDELVAGFNNMIEVVGLDPARYARYTKRAKQRYKTDMDALNTD